MLYCVQPQIGQRLGSKSNTVCHCSHNLRPNRALIRGRAATAMLSNGFSSATLNTLNASHAKLPASSPIRLPSTLLLGVSSSCTPSTPQLGSTTASRGSHISPHHPPFRQRNPRERSTITPWPSPRPSPAVEPSGKRHDGTPAKPGVAVVNHHLQPRSDIVLFLCRSPRAALGAPCADPMIGRELLSAVQLSHCPRIHSRASAPRVSSKKRHPCRSEPSTSSVFLFLVSHDSLPASAALAEDDLRPPDARVFQETGATPFLPLRWLCGRYTWF